MANCNTIQAIRNKVQGNVTAESAFPAVAGGTVRALCAMDADIAGGIFDGLPFRVRATFKAVPGASGNFTGKVYWNNGANTNLTTFTNDAVFLTSGTIALGTQAASILTMSATLVWDSVAQRLAGVNDPQSFHTIAVPAVLFSGASAVTATNNPVSAGPITNLSGASFFATALFGTGNVANATTLLELALEQI